MRRLRSASREREALDGVVRRGTMPTMRRLVTACLVLAAGVLGACASLKSPDDSLPGPDSSVPRGDADAPESTQTRDAALDEAAPVEAAPPCVPGITDFPIDSMLSAGPSSIALGPDGNLWFSLSTEFGSMAADTGDAVGLINPAGTTSTAFELPTVYGGPIAVTAGPDGRVWFVEWDGKIGHIDTDGKNAAEFPIPASAAGPSKPNGITVGPDKNIWFTDTGANQVGWIATTGGPVTVIPVPTSDSIPAGIVAGPDGNIWFAEQRGNQIATVATTAGAMVTEYPLPKLENPHGLAVGPDHNLWFASYGGTDIGRVTVAGAVTLFPVGTLSWEIAAGPGDAMWFTEGNQIGRISVDGGGLTNFTDPTPTVTGAAIVGGGPSTVWFTEVSPDRIGRITVCN
jgi:streptogramin lyase